MTTDFFKKSGVIPGMLVKGKNNEDVVLIVGEPIKNKYDGSYRCKVSKNSSFPYEFIVASMTRLQVEILGISRKYALKKFDHLINQDIEDRNPMALRIMLNSRYGSLGRNEVMDHATEASNMIKKIKT